MVLIVCIGTGGFVNVYLASLVTSEAKKLYPTQNQALKVVMKQPTCIEYLIISEIHERLSLLSFVSSTSRTPVLCTRTLPSLSLSTTRMVLSWI